MSDKRVTFEIDMLSVAIALVAVAMMAFGYDCGDCGNCRTAKIEANQ